MRPEDAMKMLDLDDAGDAAPEVFTGEKIDGAGNRVPVTVSDYAVKLDKWGERRGRELMDDNEELKELAKKLGKTAAEGYWEKAVSDFHGAAFEYQPELHEHCTDKLRQDFLKNLVETPDFQAIRQNTCLNAMAAEIATGAFAAEFAKRVAEDAAERAKSPKPGSKKAKSSSGGDAEIATMRAAARACMTAKKAVDEFADAADMAGLGDGSPGNPLDPKRLAALHKRVKASPRLKKIAELAGKFRRVAQSKQRMKARHGADEVVGVTLGDELAKLVPMELLMLADDDFGDEAARRLFEKQSNVREMKAVEPVGKGPIIVTVDESGSMQGNPIETAKALALALAWIAKKQRRWCCLLGFSGGCKIDPAALLVLQPGKWDETKLLDWLTHFFGGGTTLDVPCAELPLLWPELIKLGMPRGKTDIVMITDAQVDLPATMEQSFLAFKKAEKVNMSAIVIGAQPGDLVNIADDVHQVPALTVESDAVGAVLSV
jgi:uncharacterized protein with von Willebrand factor type A (vWA) domain